MYSIAEKLKASGLFGDFDLETFNDGHNDDCDECYLDDHDYYLPWPTADQSEAILAAMGLQVVWVDTEKEWQLGQFKDFCLDECSETWVELGGAFDIPKGQRTLANNAALAWLCDNKPGELKTAIEEVK